MRRFGSDAGIASPHEAARGGGRAPRGSEAGPIDWSGLMRLGLGTLRLPPEQFWAMTPWELSLALEGAGLKAVGGTAPDRGALDRLMAAFPDNGRE